MTWLRYSDAHRRDPVWDGMPYDTRWHYDCLIEACAQRYDGRIPLNVARRCSDVDDPERCHDELVDAGLLKREEGVVVVLRVEEHVPPEGMRPENRLPRKRTNQAEYRRRKCERGEHSKDCPPKSCPVKLERSADRVAERVTGNAGTGRNGTGQAATEEPTTEAASAKPVTRVWPKTARPGQPAEVGNGRAPEPRLCSVCQWPLDEKGTPGATAHPNCEAS